ncbi:MAG: hypothetical protein K1X74_07495 [Pirellulales bacterium]|nr:hypothetical protein [Pirellulales bacterium]
MASGTAWAGDDFEAEPINYTTAPPDNCIDVLAKQLATGSATLSCDEHTGRLKALLEALDVPVSSQSLVFSKTSFQRPRISPRSPRALYFNDEVYIGFCQNGEVLEISAVDAKLGSVFYTLSQDPDAPVTIERRDNDCLLCHASTQTRGVPGHLVRSVYPDAAGLPILASGTHLIDHTSSFDKRWGGWYVTGTHGAQRHLGNLIVRDKREPEEVDREPGANVTDLVGRFDTKPYLSPYSDIVALMVLEHQTTAHNLIARANIYTRIAVYQDAELKRELKEPDQGMWESTRRRIQAVGEPLVRYLLFSGEAPLTDTVAGTSTFAADFAARGPSDPQGRSLRQFDLRARMFRYPCSYLVYSKAFNAIAPEVKDYVYRRMHEVLSGTDQTPEFAHLSPDDRRAIREILLATKPDLPDYWREVKTAAVAR